MTHHFKFEDYNSEEFKDHIARSIPNYKGMRKLIPLISRYFLKKEENVYDLGTSAGDLFSDLNSVHTRSLGISFVGYDLADNLFPKDLSRSVNLYKRDVTDPNLKFYNTSLIFSLFTLQFIPFPKRKKLIEKVYKSLNKGGAFIVCEKLYADDGLIEDIFTFSNYEIKRVNGFTADEVMKKQDDLKTIMRPISQGENEEMFYEAGFHIREVFFKSLNYAGWILIK